MERMNLEELLASKSYPGRGIVIGLTEDGEHLAIAYFIMGRSENSRNRIFVEDGDGIRTKAWDESKMKDPSLIIYAPVRVLRDTTIVTNGDQTDTVYEHLKKGLTFEQALETRRFEPDPPNYTPRISGIAEVRKGKAFYKLSILKSADGDPGSDRRFTYSYSPARSGEGHFISTYIDDGNPLPSFSGEPVSVAIGNDQETFTQGIWKSLDSSNKVSLFTRFIDLKSGKAETRIINRNA